MEVLGKKELSKEEFKKETTFREIVKGKNNIR